MQNRWGELRTARNDLRRTVVAVVLSLAISAIVWALVVTFHVA
jgi:hypothetical protein